MKTKANDGYHPHRAEQCAKVYPKKRNVRAGCKSFSILFHERGLIGCIWRGR
jgi:hypothetical protein